MATWGPALLLRLLKAAGPREAAAAASANEPRWCCSCPGKAWVWLSKRRARCWQAVRFPLDSCNVENSPRGPVATFRGLRLATMEPVGQPVRPPCPPGACGLAGEPRSRAGQTDWEGPEGRDGHGDFAERRNLPRASQMPGMGLRTTGRRRTHAVGSRGNRGLPSGGMQGRGFICLCLQCPRVSRSSGEAVGSGGRAFGDSPYFPLGSVNLKRLQKMESFD